MLFVDYYVMILLALPIWDQTGLYVEHDLKWVWQSWHKGLQYSQVCLGACWFDWQVSYFHLITLHTLVDDHKPKWPQPTEAVYVSGT